MTQTVTVTSSNALSQPACLKHILLSELHCYSTLYKYQNKMFTVT